MEDSAILAYVREMIKEYHEHLRTKILVKAPAIDIGKFERGKK